MHWDVLILDLLAKKQMDSSTLKRGATGGTEGTIIRIAEAIASHGFRVAVVQMGCPKFKTKKGKHCYFIHGDNVPADTTCDHYIQVRNVGNSDLFPGAKKYVWMHDNAPKSLRKWEPYLLKHKITMICVSQFQKRSFQKYFSKYKDIICLYNPVAKAVYIPRSRRPKPDKNMIVWMSATHRGLYKALELHQKIMAKRPTIKLLVFHPGYEKEKPNLAGFKGVRYMGARPPSELWKVVKKALCVFYPSNFVETFCCSAAEANALGTPLATYSLGALPEVVSSRNQLVKFRDEDGLIKKVIGWHDRGRPSVSGKEEFRLENISRECVGLLTKRKL